LSGSFFEFFQRRPITGKMKGKSMPMLLILLEDDVGCWFEKPDTGGPEIGKITNKMKL
jgi:hypothetical protein